MIRRWALVAALLVAVGGAGCQEGAPQVGALDGDPMASYEPPDAELVDRSELAGGEIAGKPVRAAIVQRYRLAATANADAVRRTAVDDAQDAGWTFFSEGRIASATKDVDGREATLSIETRPEGGDTFMTVTLLDEVG